jgi:pimeloyl-ACP methyl ester carboxylesterase
MAAADRLPVSVRTVADLARIDAAARREEVRSGGGLIVWRCWGAGEPVVLLHGGSGSWSHWARNIEALVAAGRQVWVPDLPGFGESSPPAEGGDADALPDPMEAALRALLGDTPVVLVGFSFGGMVASFIAARYPARARRLVLVGAPALGLAPARRIVLRAWSHLAPGAARDAAHRANLATLMLHRPESVDELALAIHSENLPRDRMKLRRLSRTDILRRTLPAIACPVHAIWGAEDALYRGIQDRIAPALAVAPDFRGLAMIAEAGHWVQFENPVEFDRALAATLAQ